MLLFFYYQVIVEKAESRMAYSKGVIAVTKCDPQAQ